MPCRVTGTVECIFAYVEQILYLGVLTEIYLLSMQPKTFGKPNI